MKTRTPTIREVGRTSYLSMVISPGSPSWLFRGARESFRPTATACCTGHMTAGRGGLSFFDDYTKVYFDLQEGRRVLRSLQPQ